MKTRSFPGRLAAVASWLLLACAPLAPAAEKRELTDTQGRKIQAEVQELTPEGVLKVRVAGKAFDIPLEQLVVEDREWAKGWEEDRQAAAEGQEYGKVLFEDDFSKEGFGERWGHYKSGSTVKDGVLQGFSPDPSDHAAVDNVKIEGQQDMEVSVRFRFMGEKGRQLDVWLDDWGFKGSHAGHICRVSVGRNHVSMTDAKEGSFRKDIYEKKKAGGELDKETLKSLEGKSAKFDLRIKPDEWHTLTVRTTGDEVTALVDGKKIG
ncbi:MAG: hypothetical protein EOP87_10245, partial [Verrucomicrobiaceae bacterium]